MPPRVCAADSQNKDGQDRWCLASPRLGMGGDTGLYLRENAEQRLSYVRALFNELRGLGEIEFDHPLSLFRATRLQEQELSYLDAHQIERLFHVLRSMTHPHVELIAMICLVTGCRWGEAQGLTISRVGDGMLQFVNTRSKRRRAVPIDPKFADRIRVHLWKHGALSNCRDQFDEAVSRAGPDCLPDQNRTSCATHLPPTSSQTVATY